MPTSKPFSASSFAHSCPIPESDAVTIATGLISISFRCGTSRGLSPASRRTNARPSENRRCRVACSDGEEERNGGNVAIELSLFNNSVTTMVNHLTNFYPDEAELETYVLCARVKCPNIPGGSGLNWVISPGGDELAPGVLRGVLEALEETENGNGKGP